MAHRALQALWAEHGSLKLIRGIEWKYIGHVLSIGYTNSILIARLGIHLGTCTNADTTMTMKHKDMIHSLYQLSSSPILKEAQVEALKDAELILAELAKRFDMVGRDALDLIPMLVKEFEAPRLTPRMAEQFKGFRHFASEIAPVLDKAAECEVHDAERLQALYRSLDLSDVDRVDHPNAGKNVFHISGRKYGADDDSPALIYAKDEQEALDIYLANELDLGEEELEEHTDEDPVYFICVNDHIGIVDYRGRIALK